MIFEQNNMLRPIEIKASQTVSYDFYKELAYFKDISNCQDGYLIYGGVEDLPKNTLSWKNMYRALQ